MASRKELSIEKRSAIIALRQAGHSLRYIARLQKLSVGGVQHILKRHADTRRVFDRSHPGQPRKPSKHEDKFIKEMSKKNRFKTARQIRAELIETRQTSMSISTVKRRPQAAGLKGCVAARKPLLRKINKRKRLTWARKHKDWTRDQWKKVLFTDESKFEIIGSKSHQFVHRTVGQRMLSNLLSSMEKVL